MHVLSKFFKTVLILSVYGKQKKTPDEIRPGFSTKPS